MKNKRAFWFTLILLLFTLGVGSVRGIDRHIEVKVWVTTDDQNKKLEQQPSISFSKGYGVGGNTIFVDESQRYQTIEGFGASFTDSAAYLLNQTVPPSQLNSVMTSLFDRRDGIAIGFVRNPMGASDLARFIYSYQDSNGGQRVPPELPDFSITHDLVDIVPLIRMAEHINPQLKIMASPWSPPGWMKTSGSMIGGSLRPDAYAAFADYFVKFIKAYAAEGIPIDYISLQNEPLNAPADYPGMSMDPATQVVVLRDYVLPALSANNIDTKVLVYDHNWDRSDYPDSVLSDPVLKSSAQIAGIAWHGYGGTPGAMTTLRNKYPDKGNYQTEHSGGTWIPDQVKADFEEITQVMRNWGKAYIKWGLALDENRGPHTGGCGVCTPLVTVNSSTGAVQYEIDYYTLGHFSKFVLPGAHRIYSSNAEGFVSAAFKNPDGSNVLVAYNDTPAPRTVRVAWGDRSFTYDFQGMSGATFIWEGRQDDGYSVKATAQSIQASSYNEISGIQTEVTSDANGGYNLGYIDDGDWALYKNIDFGSGARSVRVRVASAGNGGTIEFHLNGTDGPLIGWVAIPVTGGWQTWTTVSTSITGASGTNDLYIVFRGTTNIGNVNWFQFSTSAAGAVAIDSCRTLTHTNTTYKLTTDLTSCGDCLVVANNKITIDLQGHSITSTCPGGSWGITDQGRAFDGITVKNGTVTGYEIGVVLSNSTRVSVLGVKATNNSIVGIWVGDGLVKSSETSGNDIGIEVDGDRSQVQQCNSHDNISIGIAALGDHCLITRNFANGNGGSGIAAFGNKCTVSFNTANSNGVEGIDAGFASGGTRHLVTGNTAINNADVDFAIACPSDVTNNRSSGGSYNLIGPGCHFVNNF